jgi:hypothetical protein
MDFIQPPKIPAYVKCLGDFPMARVQFPLEKYSDTAAPFVPKEDG